ncbi:hypothetical protein PVAP13_5KG366807 [Panicum virgatum]|uniref:Uncharacterized protein n=1 Tax=Panicum virgatum TaxID=38727 RepID=A0A8T0SIK3_PANVG|nr:hypothetical protein PVAP13_5KG366807 [Panicum virgatum]
MRNGARLQQFGLPALATMLGKNAAIPPYKNLPKRSNGQDSDSDYDPDQDDNCEGDLCAANKAKVSKKTCKETSNKSSANMAPGGVKPRSKKRVVADQQSTRTIRPLGSNHLFKANDGFDQPNSNISVANGSDGIDDQQGNGTFLPDGHNLEPCIRGSNMGKALKRLSRARRGKLTVVIAEGKKRPAVTLVAAKFTTECNIAVRNDIPVLKNWKEYKKQPGLLRILMGRLKVNKVDIDINAAGVKKACYEMMKSAVHQQRYRLKKKYFNPYPLHLVTKTSPVKSMIDTQWNDLGTCETNKTNRSNVKYHQTTGSRSYEVHLENLCCEHGDKYKDQELDALDLFKECHYSNKKNGYTAVVQSAIKIKKRFVIEVVVGVLAQNTKKSTFLQNVGINNNQPTSGGQNLQAELLAQRENAQLRLLVNSQREQMDELAMKLQETEQGLGTLQRWQGSKQRLMQNLNLC